MAILINNLYIYKGMCVCLFACLSILNGFKKHTSNLRGKSLGVSPGTFLRIFIILGSTIRVATTQEIICECDFLMRE